MLQHGQERLNDRRRGGIREETDHQEFTYVVGSLEGGKW